MAPLRSHADRRLERARHSLHADVLNHLTPDDLVQQALERGTLSVCMGADGGWEIEQLLRASNQPVSPATAIAVQRWLANESVSN